MEGHRSYPQESEPRWYGGDPNYPGEPEWDPRYGDQGYRVPPGRQPPTGPPGPVGPRSGQPLPPLPPDPLRDPLPSGDLFGNPGGPGPGGGPAPSGGPGSAGGPEEPLRYHAESIERAALRRSAGPAPVGDGVYRTRRPVIAIPLAVLTVVLLIPTGRVLLSAAFGPSIVPSGVIAATLLLIGLPMLAAGVYGLMTGAARVPDAPGFRAWLRPPLAYLLVGLACALAAALATG